MSIRYSVQVMELQSGDQLKAVTGSTVTLYTGNINSLSGLSPYGTFTENNSDGLYYIDVSISGVYTIVVDGVIQTALKGVMIDANEGRCGQGTVDTDISYIELTNANGTTVYIYPNSTGDGINVSTSKP